MPEKDHRLTYIAWGLLLVLLRPVAGYAAAQAEGATAPIVLQGPIVSSDEVPLSALAVDEPAAAGAEETILSYLLDVEKELQEARPFHADQAEAAVLNEDSLLDDYVGVALERHLPTEIAQDKVDLQKRKLVKVVRDLFPEINLSYDHNKGFKLLKYDTPSTTDTNRIFRSRKWNAAFKQPLFKGGALVNAVKEAMAELRAAKAEYDKVFLDLSIEVGKAYFNYAKAKTMLSFREDIIRKANEALTISEEKMKVQLISEIEHLNVQSQQSQLLHDLEQAKEDIALALIDMQKALRYDVNKPVEVALLSSRYATAAQAEIDAFQKENTVSAAAEEGEPQDEEKLEQLLALAYENRPEFVIQKSKVDGSVYAEKQAVAGWFPDVTFQYARGQKIEHFISDPGDRTWDEEQRVVLDSKWNVAGNTFKHVYDKNRQGTGVEATEPANAGSIDGYYDRKNTVSFAVLDGLDQFAATKEAQIKRKEALLQLEMSEKDIVSEVKESFYNYNRALTQMKSAYKKLAYRKKLVALAQHRSEINEIQLSEYLQAEIDLLQENDSLYKAMVDFYIAKISLNKAIGIDGYYPIVTDREVKKTKTEDA